MNLSLGNLHNPQNYIAILTKNDGVVETTENQRFQILGKWIELWENIENGELICVKRWMKSKSIITYLSAQDYKN